MSAKELESFIQGFAEAFNKRDLAVAADMLSDDLQVFDHVPYRFDGKEAFVRFLAAGLEGIAAGDFAFRQLSCRTFGNDFGVANAYDSFSGASKDGKPIALHGRTTLVAARQGGRWKIVSAHFSPLPHA
jgi:uncharacterized protein (TIGR02246 family)